MVDYKVILITLGLALSVSAAPKQLGSTIAPLGRIQMDVAEIASYMPATKQLFVVGEGKSLEILDISNPTLLKQVASVPLAGSGSSVTVYGNRVAVSSLSNPENDTGFVEIFESDLSGKNSLKKLATLRPCHQPDMLTFTPDGKNILVACEGEKSTAMDPKGAVAIIDSNFQVSALNFDDASIEPEYITVSRDSKTAWVSLQENNAVAKIDIANKRIEQIFDLGYVDRSKPGFGLDAIKDGKVNIVNENMWTLRQPDGIKAFEANGKHYLLTANEGAEVSNPESVYGLKGLSKKAGNAALKYGSRSISLFDGANGKLLWDSGDLLEQAFAKVAPDYFNWNSKKGKKKVDARSDDMGCEPENVTVGEVNNRRLAFVGLERMSGIAVFDMTDISKPALVDYYMDPEDRGPEGILFIPAEESPLRGQALLVVGYEYSKTLVIYGVK